MAEILGLGLSHFGGFMFPDGDMSSRIKARLANGTPAPSPARCFDLGQALARALKPSPWRIALIATASFSHAFLTKKNHFFYPDMESDRPASPNWRRATTPRGARSISPHSNRAASTSWSTGHRWSGRWRSLARSRISACFWKAG